MSQRRQVSRPSSSEKHQKLFYETINIDAHASSSPSEIASIEDEVFADRALLLH